MAKEHGQIVTSIVKQEEQLAGLTQLLEVVARSTGQQEGFTGGQSQAQEPQPSLALAGSLEELWPGLVETCPALRNRWSRLMPHLGQGQ